MSDYPVKSRSSLPALLESPWLFCGVVYCWSWFFWLSAAVLRAGVQTTLGGMLLLLGLLGPMLGGIGITYLTQGTEGRRRYWLRIVDPRRIPAIWWAVILLFMPVLMTAAVMLDVGLGGSDALVHLEKRMTPLLYAPLTLIPVALGVFVRGPFPEELGWRGYLLDRLQTRWNALGASLVLGAIWALWHLPLFFIEGMIHHTEGVGSPWFWQFMTGVIAMTFILTWIFNNTRRSTLAAILFHFTANLTYVLGNVTPGTNFYSTVLLIIAATAVVAFFGPRTLARRKSA